MYQVELSRLEPTLTLTLTLTRRSCYVSTPR